MLKFIRKLHASGVVMAEADERRYIYRANFIALTIQGFIIPYSVVFYLLGASFHAGLLLVAWCFFIPVYKINGSGRHTAAKIWLVVLIQVCLYYFGASFGQEASLHYVFFVFITIPFLIFGTRQYKLLIASLAVFVFTFYAMEFEWLPIQVVLTPQAQKPMHVAILTLVLVWLTLNYFYFEVSSRRAEAKLRANNDLLVAKNRELEQFAYIASHDLQEPLQTLKSFSGLLNEQSDNVSDEGRVYLKYISEAAARMSHLVRGLMEYSRLGRDHEITRVDCNNTLQHVLQDLNASITKSGAQIEAGALPVVQGHETELHMLFQNLLGNAIKFTKPGTVPQVKVSAEKVNGSWQFAFADSGIGIDEKYLEKIFLIFQRLHKRGEYEGTGIGLAHCKKIVELHGGKIWVHSQPGHGSTFYFTIPG